MSGYQIIIPKDKVKRTIRGGNSLVYYDDPEEAADRQLPVINRYLRRQGLEDIAALGHYQS